MKRINAKGANTQIFYNFVSTFVRTGISFFTMPVFTRLLGAEQYGLYSLAFSWISILSCMMGFNIGSGLARGMYKYNDTYQDFKSSLLLAGTVISTGIIAVLLSGYPVIGSLVRFDFPIYCIVITGAFAEFVISFVGVTWIYEKKAVNNMVLTVVTVLTTTALSMILIFFWPDQEISNLYYARVIGTFVPQVLTAFFLWAIVYFRHPYGFSREYWKYGLNFGIPMVFHTLSHNILTASDRLMMQQFKTDGAVIGIYSFFYTFASILNSVLSTLGNSWCPFYMDNLDSKNYSNLNKMVKNYVQVFTVITIGFLMLAREMTYIFANEEYWSGLSILPLIILAIYCVFIYQFYVNYEAYEEKPKIITTGTVFAACVNILLNYFFIPKYGMYGAAAATLAGYAALVFFHAFIVYRLLKNKYPLPSIPLLTGFVTVAAFCFLYYILADFWPVRWMIGILSGMYLLREIYKRKTIF